MILVHVLIFATHLWWSVDTSYCPLFSCAGLYNFAVPMIIVLFTERLRDAAGHVISVHWSVHLVLNMRAALCLPSKDGGIGWMRYRSETDRPNISSPAGGASDSVVRGLLQLCYWGLSSWRAPIGSLLHLASRCEVWNLGLCVLVTEKVIRELRMFSSILVRERWTTFLAIFTLYYGVLMCFTDCTMYRILTCHFIIFDWCMSSFGNCFSDAVRCIWVSGIWFFRCLRTRNHLVWGVCYGDIFAFTVFYFMFPL